ncbi:MAG: DUF1624 domain-containing protein [Candidatus Solibacter usitatus]|nr:DUF1624 domain-containing protein [Candidatus Solibacter usitatus]
MSSVKPDRLPSIDLLRGLIMVVMALDHVSLMVGRFHSSEMWAGAWTQYSSALPFLTRFVTHFCAPGFFFLMGVGASLLADARRKQGWSDGRIARFLLVRSLLLILVSMFIEIPAWLTAIMSAPPDMASGPAELIPGMTQPRFVFTVLIGLAGSMILSAAFIRFRSAVWAVLATAALLGSALTTPGPPDVATPYSFLRTLLMISRWSHGVWVQYPIIPWFGTAALGVLFGRWIVHDRAAAFRSIRWIGLGAVLAAIALRAYGGFGNIRPPRDGSWIEFLNFIKYPPALVFTLFMLGGDLLLLDLIERTRLGRMKLGRLLQVFGQVPLAYYLAHLWLFAIVGAIWFRQGAGYLAVYIIWIAGLVPLYFITRWYRDFKMAKSADSLWRFF